METKICKECGKELPITDFGTCGGGQIRPQCRPCYNARYSKRNTETNKKYRQNNAQHVRDLANERSQDPDVKDKRRVHALVYYHTKMGHIQRKDYCEACGATGVKIEAHHEDYSKPLEVIYLCRSCHALISNSEV